MSVKVASLRFDSVGDGSGIVNFNGDYSETPITAYLRPSLLDGVDFLNITKLAVVIKDASMDTGKYGGFDELTNGINAYLYRGDELIQDLTEGSPIMTNTDWIRFLNTAQFFNFGTGDDLLKVTEDLRPGEMILDSANDYNIRIVLNDDFTGLVDHEFTAQAIVNDSRFI